MIKQTDIVTQRSHHGLSYFHLNDVLVDVIPVVLTRHTVVDVILAQVMLTGVTHKHTHTHTQTHSVLDEHNLNSVDEYPA